MVAKAGSVVRVVVIVEISKVYIAETRHEVLLPQE
jgi:hypothetical protein